MTTVDQAGLISRIVNPRRQDASVLLGELGFADIPSQEQVLHDIEAKLLLPPTGFPEHLLSTYQITWDRELCVPSLLSLGPSPPPTSVSFVRAGLEGRIIGYTETPNKHSTTGLTSTSINRTPAPAQNFVRGRSGYVPFLPGGLDDIIKSGENERSPVNKKRLREVAPGLSRGIRLPGELDNKNLGLDVVGTEEGEEQFKEQVCSLSLRPSSKNFCPRGDYRLA